MNLANATAVYAGGSPAVAVYAGSTLIWSASDPLLRMLYTQIDSETPVAHEFDGRVPIPTVSVDTGVIAEDPVGVPVELSVPVPTVSVDTGVIAEDPVGKNIELSVPPVPTVSVDTDVNENP